MMWNPADPGLQSHVTFGELLGGEWTLGSGGFPVLEFHLSSDVGTDLGDERLDLRGAEAFFAGLGELDGQRQEERKIRGRSRRRERHLRGPGGGRGGDGADPGAPLQAA